MKYQLEFDKVVRINNHKFIKTYAEEIKIYGRSIYRRTIDDFNIFLYTVGTTVGTNKN